METETKQETIMPIAPEREIEIIRETKPNGEVTYRHPVGGEVAVWTGSPAEAIESDFYKLEGLVNLVNEKDEYVDLVTIFYALIEKLRGEANEMFEMIEREIGEIECDIVLPDQVYLGRRCSMKREIKINGKVICIKESGGSGKIVYKHASNSLDPIEVYTEDIETYVNCAIENFKGLEDLILLGGCDEQDAFSWVSILRVIRRDTEHRIKRLFDVLYETIGPLHCVHRKSRLADFPLIDVVHKDDLDKIEEAAG